MFYQNNLVFALKARPPNKKGMSSKPFLLHSSQLETCRYSYICSQKVGLIFFLFSNTSMTCMTLCTLETWTGDLNISSKTKGLDLRRASLSLLRAQLEVTIKDNKRAREGRDFFKNTLLDTQTQFSSSLLKSSEVGRTRTLLA